jgi:paraquat-inducible protein B
MDGEGIEAGKTKVRYKSVDIGDVKTVTLEPDGRTVKATIDTAKFAVPFLLSDNSFWIVRPRLGASGVSGLGTLLSGAFIAMDVGASKEEGRTFAALEHPPAVSHGAKGRQFILAAADVGSLAAASPVYFHRLQVGQVSDVTLNLDGHGVTLKIFIDAPYDRFVTEASRFWHASGVDVEVDSAGVHVQSESLATILAGGIAFEAPLSAAANHPSPEDAHFMLAANRLGAMKAPDGVTESYILYFNESLRGLSPGAVVDFRGVEIGEVIALNLAYDRGSDKFVFPVLINIYPQRLLARYAKEGDKPDVHAHSLVARMIKQGFRGQLRTASLLTGQLYIALDFFPDAAKVAPLPELEPMPLPTMPGNLEQIQASIINVARKLDQLPLNKIALDADAALVSLNRVLGSANGFIGKVDSDILPEAQSTLSQARLTLRQTQQTLEPEASLQSDLHSTLSSVSRAADSVRALADYLDKHPESLIRGKQEESK